MSYGSYEELLTVPQEELRQRCALLGIQTHHKNSVETLAKAIVDHVSQPPKQRDPMQHQATTPSAPVHNNTPDMVLEAIKNYAAIDGFEAKFPDDGTWVFKCKGAEESGNLAIPLRIIKQKAEFVSKGRRALRSMGKDNTYPGSYADNILVG